METFTELRPEALEWLGLAKRSRQLENGAGWGLQGGAQWVGHRKHLSGQLCFSVHQLWLVRRSTVPF